MSHLTRKRIGGSEGGTMSLSITNNMDVLRKKLLRELIHRREVNRNKVIH